MAKWPILARNTRANVTPGDEPTVVPVNKAELVRSKPNERSSVQMNVKQITDDQAETIKEQLENHFYDVKAIEIAPAKLTRSLAAFANSAGGEIYIGISENEIEGKKVREWRGFVDPEAANGHVQCFDSVFPLGSGVTYQFLKSSSKFGETFVLHAVIQKTRDVKTDTKGMAYIRRGAQNLPVAPGEALERLKLDKGIISFEDQSVQADFMSVTNSTVILNFLLQVIPTVEPDEWLKKQLLLHQDHNHLKPVVAAVLLFSEEPQAVLPKRCGVKIYRYKTNESEGSRSTLAGIPISVEGCLYVQITAAVDMTIEMLEEIKILGARGLEPIKYPRETLHEIITNAVLHRDYSIATDIQIRVFDNRIEIESPGKLPGHITPANILKEQFARNPRLVRLINKFPDPPNKDVGEGLNTAFEAMRQLRLKEPVIEERDASVVVNVRHEPLASPEESILEYLLSHTTITNSIGRELTGITSENKMKDVFNRLKKTGQLERIPDKKIWRKPETGESGV